MSNSTDKTKQLATAQQMELTTQKATKVIQKKPSISLEEQDENIRKLNQGMGWTMLLSDGSVILARIQALTKTATVLVTLACAAIVLDVVRISGSTNAIDVQGYKPVPSVVSNWTKGMQLNNVTAQFSEATPTAQQYAELIEKLKANPGAIQEHCVAIDDPSQSWLNPSTGLPNLPRCKISSDSETVWLMTFVQNKGASTTIHPTIGVFHSTQAGWQYFNFETGLGQGVVKIQPYQTIGFSDISAQVAKDFPSSMQITDVTVPDTAVGKISKSFNKLFK